MSSVEIHVLTDNLNNKHNNKPIIHPEDTTLTNEGPI